jgi:hypothetical protein
MAARLTTKKPAILIMVDFGQFQGKDKPMPARGCKGRPGFLGGAWMFSAAQKRHDGLRPDWFGAQTARNGTVKALGHNTTVGDGYAFCSA